MRHEQPRDPSIDSAAESVGKDVKVCEFYIGIFFLNSLVFTSLFLDIFLIDLCIRGGCGNMDSGVRIRRFDQRSGFGGFGSTHNDLNLMMIVVQEEGGVVRRGWSIAGRLAKYALPHLA